MQTEISALDAALNELAQDKTIYTLTPSMARALLLERAHYRNKARIALEMYHALRRLITDLAMELEA